MPGDRVPGKRLTPSQRSLHARLAAHSKWASTDATEGTAPARRAFLDRFEHEVDPDGTLPPAERARRAEHARKAYFTRLALASAKTRRTRTNPAVGSRASRQDLGGAA